MAKTIAGVPSVSWELPLVALLETQAEIIDLMAGGADLDTLLRRIAKLVERLAPPALCSILLLKADGRHLRSAAAPSLPEEYTNAINGLEIGPDVGSCGTAAYLKQPVVVTDIATDAKWAPARDFALSFGLRACWSMPVITDDGTVLGTIAMYYTEPRAPSGRDWGLLAPAARLVRLALAQARKESALRESEARWQLAAAATGLGTYDVDLSVGTSVWSPALYAILGLMEDVPPSRDAFASVIHPDDVNHFDARPQAAANSVTGMLPDLEMRIRRANDGQERVVLLRGQLVPNADGVAARVIGTVADITAQRHYERNLSAAKMVAEEANRAKSEFLAGMSHELRTPLNAIIGFSDLIRHCTLGPISPAKYREYVDDIHKSGSHLLSLINDLLDVAKIESGKQEFDRTEVRLAAVAVEALRFVERQASTNRLTLDTRIDGDIALIADERAITQILTNLLSNAVKFTQPGGRVAVFAGRLTDGGIAVGVEDTGIGMTKDGIEKALEPFGQVERMTTVEGRGTGLGLPLVKALLEAQGAQFRIESMPGKGTRVWGEFLPSVTVAHRAVA